MSRDVFTVPDGYVMVSHDYCLVPGTRILTADLRWVPIETLTVGQELVGFDEKLSGHSNKMRGSIVERTARLTRPCYRVTTDRGVVVSSEEHLWVARNKRGVRSWKRTDALVPGDQLSYWIEPWEEDRTYDGGWLAGFFDGEGFVSGGSVGFGQNEGSTLSRALTLLKERGFDVGLTRTTGMCWKGYVRGERLPGLRLLGMLRPGRLLAKARAYWDGRRSWGNNSSPAQVLSVEAIGEQEVIAVRSSTGTFIAEGFMSHNCQLELVVAAALSGDPAMRQIFVDGVDFHKRAAQLAAPLMGKKPEDVTDVDRRAAKCIVFGRMYGRGIKAIAAQIGCTYALAEQYVNAVFGVFKTYDAWSKAMVHEVRTTGQVWVPSPLDNTKRGRRRPLWNIADQDDQKRNTAENGAVNTGIQGLASDYLMLSLVEVVRWIQDTRAPAKVVLTVYDQIVGEVREDFVPTYNAKVSQVMEGWPCAVPLKADVETGQRWGSLSKLKKPSA
jgi:hypothetical protein